MEEFIEAFKEIDNKIQKGIIEKIKKKQKLEEYEIVYINEIKNFIERKKARNKGVKNV